MSWISPTKNGPFWIHWQFFDVIPKLMPRKLNLHLGN